MKNPEEILHDNPGSVIFAQYAEQCAREGDVERALDILHSGVEANPVYAPGYSVLGNLYYSQNNFNEALKYWKKGLELDPLMPRDIYRMGVHCLENDMLSEAVKYLEIATVFEPHNQQILAYREEAESRDMTTGDLGLAEETMSALTEITSHGTESAIMIPEVIDEEAAQDEPEASEPIVAEPAAGLSESDTETYDGGSEDVGTDVIETTPDISEPESTETTDVGSDETEMTPTVDTSLNEYNRVDTVEEEPEVEEDLLASMDFTLDSLPDEETIDFKALLDDFEFGMTNDESEDDEELIAGLDLDHEEVEEEPDIPEYDDGMYYNVLDIVESNSDDDETTEYEDNSEVVNTNDLEGVGASDEIGNYNDTSQDVDTGTVEEESIETEEATSSERDDSSDETSSADDTLVIIDKSAPEPQAEKELSYENLLDNITDYVNGGRYEADTTFAQKPEEPVEEDDEMLQPGSLSEDIEDVESTEDEETVNDITETEDDLEPEYSEPELIQDAPLETDDVLNDYKIDMTSYDLGMNETIPPAGYDPNISYEEPEEFVIDLDEVAGDDTEESPVEPVATEEMTEESTASFTETFLEDFDYDAFSRDIESLLEPFRKAENGEPEVTTGGEVDETVSISSDAVTDEEYREDKSDDDSFYGTLSPEEISMLSNAGEEEDDTDRSVDEEDGIDYTDIIAETQDTQAVQESMAEEFEKHVQATMAPVPEAEVTDSQTDAVTEKVSGDEDTAEQVEAPSEPEVEEVHDDIHPEPAPPEPPVSQPVSEPVEAESLDDLLSGYVSLIEEENHLVEPEKSAVESELADLSPEEKAFAEDVSEMPKVVAPAEEKEGEPLTATMAEIYVKQGLISRAVAMYVKLLEKQPDNQQFMERLAELRYIEETRQDDDA